MLFKPTTQELFANDGRLIKRLSCPFKLDWNKLKPTDDPAARSCEICQHQVTDTALRTEEELLALVKDNPHACLKVDLNQDNLIVTV